MTSDYSNVVSMTFSVAMEDSPPLGSALNPIVIDSDEFESDQMEDFQLDGHGVFEVDDIAIEASYQPNVGTLGSKYNPIIIDDDEHDDVDNDALDALFRTQVGNTYQLWY